MAFAAELRDTLQSRQDLVSHEPVNGERLEHVLSKHLLAVEAVADPDLITSILLLSGDRKRLFQRRGRGTEGRLGRSTHELTTRAPANVTLGRV